MAIPNPLSKFKRRSFIQWLGLGWLAAIAQSCFRSGQQADSAGPVVVGSVSDLDRAGVLEQRTPLGPVLVTRDLANPESLKAVNPTCTHQGCIVKWQAQAQALVCPCHNARYGQDGTVLEGPAGTALPTYSARIEGSNVVIEG
jgi:cytochrome b6-f complex iron-sulfur subunit